MKEIDLNFSENIKIGHAQNLKDATGLTVILSEKGMNAGVSIMGGGPASRETSLLNELTDEKPINGVVLSGGSAYGLGAANGVMRYLSERNAGFQTPSRIVPLVTQACIYDCNIGNPNAYPDEIMAYEACVNAQNNFQKQLPPKQGVIGAGTGATVGKLYGNEHMMKSGIGTYAIEVGDFKIGCIISVNALGDIIDFETGEQIAGLLDENNHLISTREEMMKMVEADSLDKLRGTNTTIGCVIMNASFNRTQLNKIAQMGQDGFAMAINPVHTTMDGDTLFVVSDGDVKVSVDIAGTLAAYVVAKAILNAVKRTDKFYDYPTYRDINYKWNN